MAVCLRFVPSLCGAGLSRLPAKLIVIVAAAILAVSRAEGRISDFMRTEMASSVSQTKAEARRGFGLDGVLG